MPGLLLARVVPAQLGLAVKATFYIVGAVVEFGGILLVASPDLVPFADRLAAWSRPRVRAVKKRLGLGTRSDVHGYHASDSVTVSDRASAAVSSGATTLEGKVEFLLRRDADAQHHMNKLVERVMDLEERVTGETDTLRQHAEGRIETRIEETQWEYRVVRWWGGRGTCRRAGALDGRKPRPLVVSPLARRRSDRPRQPAPSRVAGASSVARAQVGRDGSPERKHSRASAGVPTAGMPDRSCPN